jgi:hypothetical protein
MCTPKKNVRSLLAAWNWTHRPKYLSMISTFPPPSSSLIADDFNRVPCRGLSRTTAISWKFIQNRTAGGGYVGHTSDGPMASTVWKTIGSWSLGQGHGRLAGQAKLTCAAKLRWRSYSLKGAGRHLLHMNTNILPIKNLPWHSCSENYLLVSYARMFCASNQQPTWNQLIFVSCMEMKQSSCSPN